MVNSSPEYAITKPGVRPLSRKRDKPLRTYGRQATATPEPRSEPAAKRPGTAYAVPGDKNVKPLGISVPEDARLAISPALKPKKQPAAEDDQENLPPSNVEPNVRVKRSILNYFKPVVSHLAQVKPSTTNILPNTETTEVKETRPVPPLKRRLLRILSNQSTSSEGEVNGSEREERENGVAIKEGSFATRKRRLGGSGSGSAGPEPRRVKRKPVIAEVQTTLNISNQAAFSECKLCDTVWNPLYPDDVKYHTKRHAAQLRAKKKLEDSF